MNIVELPSLIDMHVHLREVGYEYKETIETGLNSAYKGGFGAVCAMPNTNPICDNPQTLKIILDKAKGHKCHLYQVCAVTKNLNTNELVDFETLKNSGAIAFSNDGLPILNHSVFYNALKSENLILSHCEDETKEVKWQIDIFEELTREGKNPRLHFCHISKKASLDLIRAAKNKGLKITCESAPHYFTFTKENVTDNGIYKMNPPLGTKEDREAVVDAILDSTIDVIATDHAPHSVEEKLLPYKDSPNGIVGLEFAFSLTYEKFGLDKTLELMAYNPRKILGIKNDTKVKIDLDKTWIVKGENLLSKCKVTAYEAMELKGVRIDD